MNIRRLGVIGMAACSGLMYGCGPIRPSQLSIAQKVSELPLALKEKYVRARSACPEYSLGDSGLKFSDVKIGGRRLGDVSLITQSAAQTDAASFLALWETNVCWLSNAENDFPGLGKQNLWRAEISQAFSNAWGKTDTSGVEESKKIHLNSIPDNLDVSPKSLLLDYRLWEVIVPQYDFMTITKWHIQLTPTTTNDLARGGLDSAPSDVPNHMRFALTFIRPYLASYVMKKDTSARDLVSATVSAIYDARISQLTNAN